MCVWRGMSYATIACADTICQPLRCCRHATVSDITRVISCSLRYWRYAVIHAGQRHWPLPAGCITMVIFIEMPPYAAILLRIASAMPAAAAAIRWLRLSCFAAAYYMKAPASYERYWLLLRRPDIRHSVRRRYASRVPRDTSLFPPYMPVTLERHIRCSHTATTLPP